MISAPALNWARRKKKHEEQDQEGGNVSNLVARKTLPQQLGDRDCSRDASHLVDALGKQSQGHERDHHVAADPPSQGPAMGIDQGRKSHETSTTCQGRCIGQGKGPHPEVTPTQVVLANKWFSLPGPAPQGKRSRRPPPHSPGNKSARSLIRSRRYSRTGEEYSPPFPVFLPVGLALTIRIQVRILHVEQWKTNR